MEFDTPLGHSDFSIPDTERMSFLYILQVISKKGNFEERAVDVSTPYRQFIFFYRTRSVVLHCIVRTRMLTDPVQLYFFSCSR